MGVLEDTAALAPGNQQADGNGKPNTSTNGSEVPIGTIVKPKDRNNFGDVVEDKGAGCDVHFKAKTGEEYTRYFRKEDLCYQDGRPIIAKPFVMNSYTAPQLDGGNFEITYLVEGILVAGQPAILAGKMKTLKTTLLVALAVALVLARKFLGVFDVPRACRVGFVSCESGLGVLQETFRRVCISHCCSLADLAGLIVSDTIPRLEDPACIAALTEFCTDGALDVLILDPAYLMLTGGDAGNVFSMGERLAALNRISAECGVTVILAHHLRKNRSADLQRYAPPEMEEMAWSGFAEFARQWVLLGRRCEYEDGSGLHNLWMKVGGSAGHNSLWALDVNEGHRTDPCGRCWEVEVQPGGEVIQAAKAERKQAKADKQKEMDREGQDAIVKVLSTLPKGEGAFKFKLRAMTGISNERLARMLEQLAEQKIVEPCQALRSPTHKTTQPGAYRLTDDWWNDA